MRAGGASLLRALAADTRGAALVYVTVILGALFGFAALAIDFSRLSVTHTHAQQAAEAAALAAASQLDGKADSITRATNAAMNTPLVQNVQNLAQDGPQIAIVEMRFLDGLPSGNPGFPNDRSVLDPFVTTDPFEARFVEVLTESLTVNNSFVQAVGAAATGTTSATAVAGYTQVVCQVMPLAVCNPMEAASEGGMGARFDVEDWKGRQVWAKAGGGGQWKAGNFGLLDADGMQGTQQIQHMLATTQPDACVAAIADLRPGNLGNPVRTAVNTRFDMYENPGFGGSGPNSGRNNPAYRPARNVTKGLVRTTNDCSYDAPTPPAEAKKLPRDQNLLGFGETSSDPRFGNGVWDCEAYWEINHPDVPTPPFGCTSASNPGTMTRFDLYRYEIDNNMIPDNRGIDGEFGGPLCSSAPATDNPDRRVLTFAVINCEEHNVHGNMSAPVEAIVKAFITEPVGNPSNPDVFLEMIDIVQPGADDGILHDIVQLYR